MGAATFKFVLADHQKADGTQAVRLRVTRDGKVGYLNTGVFLLAKHFNKAAHTDKPNWVRDGNNRNGELNPLLRQKISAAQTLANNRPDLGAAGLVAVLKANPTGEVAPPPAPDFFALAQAELARRDNVSTINKLRTAVNWLRLFHGPAPLPLADLTRDVVRDFETWLKRQPSITSPNTVAVNLGSIRTLLRVQIDAGHLPPGADPFIRYKLPSRPTRKQKLTREELAQLTAAPLNPAGPMWRARAAYLMQYYTRGARIGDVLRLQWAELTTGRADYREGKTEAVVTASLPPQLVALLAEVRQYYPRETFVLPFLPDTFFNLPAAHQLDVLKAKTSLVNKFLKQAAKVAGIEKPISTHVARHTFAHHADRALKGDLRAVQKLTGHKKLATLQVYLGELRDEETDAAAATVYGV